jgi:Xaa-Pro dipeptidase
MKLTPEGCRSRQQRLAAALAEQGLDGAVIAQREHVYYFTGHMHNPFFAAVLFVNPEGKAILAADADTADSGAVEAIDEVLGYPAHFHCTMHCFQLEKAAKALAQALPGGRYGADSAGMAAVAAGPGGDVPADLHPTILKLRKAKDADEVEAIRASIRLTEVMYDAAKAAIQPGADEMEVFAEIQAATTREAGEFLEKFGNDFQANAMGGPPRRRKMKAGELYILDAGPRLHGYCADNCRTFAVDGSPTEAQHQAWKRLDALFAILEEGVRPGMPSADLFSVADDYLRWEGFDGLVHHLGHGFGMSPHETPELNPDYDAVFEVGDVFTMEPGLYSAELAGGMRLEENYLLAESGLEKLTSYPRDLI